MQKTLDSLKMCLNPKVVGALAVIAGIVLVFAPDLVSRALPLLILAACPLSMLLMGGAMMRGHRESGEPAAPSASGSAKELASLRGEVEELRSQIMDNRSDEHYPGVRK